MTDLYADEIRSEVSQGDLFSEVPIAYVNINAPQKLRVERVLAIILTHDCEYDKPNNHYCLVARIRSLDHVPTGSQGNIRNHRTRRAFYLPANSGVIAESYVDLRDIDRVAKATIEDLVRNGCRLASLSEDGRLALQQQLAMFFGLPFPAD